MKQKEVIGVICALIISALLASGNAESAKEMSESSILIWEFAPYCPNGLEYLVLKNIAHECISLKGYTLSDGEGKILFGDVELPAYGTISIANNASAYFECFYSHPDIEIGNSSLANVKGLFRLANANDEIYLYAPDGRLIDSVGYGKERSLEGWNGALLKNPSEGTLYKRVSVKDSNTADDWLTTKIGRTSLSPMRFREANLTAFLTPENGLNPVLQKIENATKEILLCAYTIDSPQILEALKNASKRNVSINVLVENSPAGGMSIAEKNTLSELAKFANLTCYGSPKHVRFDYIHAKYMVIDNKFSIISTENYKLSSFTPHRQVGNRGWGVIVEHEGLARVLANIFWQDAKPGFGDVGKFVAPNEKLNASGIMNSHTFSDFLPLKARGNVTLLLAPDNAENYLLRTMLNAKERVVMEAMSLPLYWDSEINPFVEAIVKLSQHGVKVEVLLESSTKANIETLSYLNSLCAANLSAKLINNKEHGFRMLHTKGFVVDNAYTYLGSANFCKNSMRDNREVGILIESREIGGYFVSVFEYDWKEDVRAPTAYIGMPTKAFVSQSVRLDGSASFDSGGIAGYYWDVDGDGQFEIYGQVVNYTFAKPGRYRVTLKVVDREGNENTTTREILISPMEVAQSEEGFNMMLLWIGLVVCALIAWKFGDLGRRLSSLATWLRLRL